MSGATVERTEDSDEVENLSDELLNVKSVIDLTRENIDLLNARFSMYSEPPQLYLAEYQELTSKLHGFKLLEQSLIERIQEFNEPTEEVRKSQRWPFW